ncbi:MFS general substrate transporter [Linnemannia elongata AG-77]|uniref:MFS general substrate transporter n=1 Tax=Linnemannia elongata AG-77 TaxID=1314771 RepID=A0A197KC82_9FUNG|nr:MFS general substrate transporter [Linnemannia elongata AG-77]
MSDSQQQQERQTYIASTGERRPLLARTIERTVSWTTARLEADQVDTDTQEAIAKKEEEEETQWFAELRRRPWLQRPSVYWLIPWSALCGVITGLCTTTMWQLRSRTMCHHLLRNPTIHTYPGSFGLLSEGVSQWAPLDECMTPTMIGMVWQLESRIVTISSVSLLLTLAKWCSLSDVYGRKVLFHIGLAGTAVYICLNWFAASRYNFLGYYVYYLEAVSFALMPAAAVLNPAIFAYCADCTQKSQRALTIGYIIVALAIGSMSGAILMMHIKETTGDPTLILRIALIIVALLAIYMSFVPESLRRKPIPLPCLVPHRDESEHETEDTTSPPPRSYFWSIVGFFNEGTSMIFDPVLAILPGRIPKSANMASSATPLLILLAHFLVSIGSYGDTNLIVSMTSLVFHWDVDDNERYQNFISLVMTVVLLGLLPLWNSAYKAFVIDDTDDPTHSAAHHDWIQHSSQATATRPLFDLEAIKMELFFSICSLLFVLVGYLLIPLFPSPTMLYLAGGLIAVGTISAVSVISLLSSVVPNQLVGAIFGAHSICQQLANIVFGLTYEPLYMKTKATSPLLYYYVSAGLVALGLLAQTFNRILYHKK